MRTFLMILLCIAVSYLIGCINPAYIIGKIKGVDIKSRGSRNAGASNALLLFGKFFGVLCAAFDIFKAWVAVHIAEIFFAQEFDFAFALAATSVILGHIFPFYMKFRGGKGLATLGGVILKYNPIIFFIMLGGALIVVFVFNYICYVPISASLAFPIIYGIMTGDIIGTFILFIPFIVILIKHSENIKRIIKGEEFRISYLWNRQKELDRMNITPEEVAAGMRLGNQEEEAVTTTNETE